MALNSKHFNLYLIFLKLSFLIYIYHRLLGLQNLLYLIVMLTESFTNTLTEELSNIGITFRTTPEISTNQDTVTEELTTYPVSITTTSTTTMKTFLPFVPLRSVAMKSVRGSMNSRFIWNDKYFQEASN